MATLFERIEPVVIEEEIRSSFIDYAMSVIVARALPDVRDGLKPVHRRILFAMLEGNLTPDRPRRKSASAVGDVIKKYHPHGDQPVYDALVRMAQDFSLRYPLVDPQGNFGSIDGDPAGAMRYCVRADSLVRFHDGTTRRIANLVPDAQPNSDTDIDLKALDRRGDRVRATRFFHSGNHPTLRLNTREGFELTGTRNHPVLCLVPVAGVPVLQWRLLEELGPGDRVALLRRPPEEVGLLTVEDDALAVLAGGLLAEGWLNYQQGGFDNTDPEYFARVLAAYDIAVGGSRNVQMRPQMTRQGIFLRLAFSTTGPFAESPLAVMVGKRSNAKVVPDFVWAGSPAFKRLFLKALFEGDGSSSLLPRRTIQISYSTRSEQLAKDVQQLLLEFGVVSKRYHHAVGEWKVCVTNRRDARLFASRVGFLGRKQARLQTQLDALGDARSHRSRDHVPYLAAYVREEGASRWTERDWLKRHNLDRIETWERDRDEILARITNPEVRAVIEPLVDGTYYYAEVASVEDAGLQPVYSLRVDSDDHSFITNGFVSHNTEARLSTLAMELLRDIDKETVDFQPNFDGYEQEPLVLPARFPNLLANGSSGIAVGLATNIPPHNLGEVIDATIAAVDKPNITLRELMKHVKGPDFPTAGFIIGTEGIREAYETGRGSVRMRARVEIEENRQGRQQIVVKELPYMVNKARLAEKIAQLADSGKIREIADLSDHSSRSEMRLVVELKRAANPHVVLNQLYKHTQLQDTFGVNMVALVDGVPRTLNLAQVIQHFIEHQVDVVTRRTKFELRKAEERDHIVQGLLIALANIDEVIKIIRASADADEARTKLMKRFKLSELQANYILDMPLRRLTRLERTKLEQEHKELLSLIRRLKALLRDPKKLRGVIKDELADIRARFADARRTEIRPEEGEFVVEDLIAEEEVVITVSRAGYVKRLPVETYRRQGRGGRGVRGATLKEEDVVQHVFTTTTHHWLLVFTNKGKVYRTKVHEVPEGTRTGRGLYVANLPGMGFSGEERIASVMDLKDYDEAKYVLFATKKGIVKKTTLAEYDSPRSGLTAINLRGDDELIDVRLTDGKEDALLISRHGQAIRFKNVQARPMGRATSGVIGMRLVGDDEVIAMALTGEGEEVISITERGYGKRTLLKDYPVKGRGTRGVITAKLTDRTGVLAGAFVGSKDDDVFVINAAGIVIRVAASQIRRTGRPSQGVRVMRIDAGDRVVAVAPVVTQPEE